MKGFLKKLKLIDHLTTELEIQQEEFVHKLKANVDEGETGYFSDMFDVFSSGKNEYKGQVGYEGFKIKMRKRLFDANMNMAVAKGMYQQVDKSLIIETEINGFHGMMIPYYVLLPIFYSIFIIAVFAFGKNMVAAFVLPFLLVHAAFMLGFPYVMMRNSVRRLKHNLEREFFYLTK